MRGVHAMTGALLGSALALAFVGIPVFPVKQDKRPACEGGAYAASTDPDEVARLFANPTAALIAMPTGPASGYDAIDIDVKRDGLAWLEANEHRLPVTRRHHTRSGGVHLLLKHTPGMRTKFDRIAPGVEVRGDGGYIVRWDVHGFFASGDVTAEWPEWLLLDAVRGQRPAGAPPVDPADLAPPSPAALIAMLQAMPNPAEASRGDYVALNLAVQGCIRGLEALGLAEGADVDAIQDAAADWCSRWDSDRAGSYEDERDRWESDWSTRENDAAGWRHVLDMADRLGVDTGEHRLAAAVAEFGAPLPPEADEPAARPAAPALPGTPAATEPTAAPVAPLGDPAWESKLTLAKGLPVPNLANVMFTLRKAPQWVGVFRYDTFASRVVLSRQPPVPALGAAPREAMDEDFALVAEWFQNQAMNVSVDTCRQAIPPVARERPFSPIVDYLTGLEWDGVARADRWLIDHLGAADTALNRAFGAKFLIGAVARVFRPGCQVDTMLVLEGRQGLRKSTALQTLAGSAWFTDHIPDLASKDAAMQLQGIWIVEHAELATLNRTDTNRAKEFISRRSDRFRPPFGKLTADFPRQCVFAATTNPNGSGYLKDETGGRRFWPVECGVARPDGWQVSIADLEAARSQLWAEAVARFKSGESWWLDSAELEAAQTTAADARYDADEWTAEIGRIVEGRAFVKTSDILSALGLAPRDWSKAQQMRVGGVLRALGWRRKLQWIDGRPVRTYTPPPGARIDPVGEEQDAEGALAGLR